MAVAVNLLVKNNDTIENRRSVIPKKYITTHSLRIKRGNSPKITFFEGHKLDNAACYGHDGLREYNSKPNDLIGAMSSLKMCFKCLEITNPKNKKKVVVKIVDECEDCKKNQVDLSIAAFSKIANPDDGIVGVSFRVVSCPSKASPLLIIAKKYIMTSVYTINYALRAHKRDPFIEFIKGMLMTPFVLHAKPLPQAYDSTEKEDSTCDDDYHMDANVARYCDILSSIEDLIKEHIRKQAKGVPDQSRLKRLVPSISTFHTQLPLRESFLLANTKHSIAARRFVPPSFNDIRRILNTAQNIAIAPKLKLITFDGDMTLYDDGKDFEHDSELVKLLMRLLEHKLYVCVVTAAGYSGDASRYEQRLSGLLKGFENARLSKEMCENFFLLGGECNYLFQCQENYHLKYIKESEYQPHYVHSWKPNQINAILDVAQENLQRCIDDMKLPCTVLRKSKAVGIVPKPNVKIFREQLDECVLSTQHRIVNYLHSPLGSENSLPFCAFNGGSDVWVDIGNKLIGVQLLQDFLGAKPHETLHVGDQFLSTGNDFATRHQCCTLWIVNPEETQNVLVELTALLEAKPERVIN
ncbi:14539_t:CDS:10 [Funneliformis geosporum]|uniref:IMP-specific 5'-nucleotidase 1 n=1 Tax=Funneliformis geosporum TaxID=1117311 RepID=A0A9W4SBY3_9GLOM|nr:12693_t:CDS:10 [Funneliformis geosporum]CAI2165119.1 14539_t:CDS:10 [Funneliformis geosporum]